jgi:aldose 1-epimerase
MRSLLTLTRRTRWSKPSVGGTARTGVVIASVIGLAAAGTLGMRLAPAAPAAPAGNCSPTVSRAPFGKAVEPYTGKLTQVFRYTLTNCHGMQVKIITYGATQQSVLVPGPGGKTDVILGFRTLHQYVTENSAPPPVGGPYFGETVGRYANRIARGTFTLDGHTYTLPINNGVNSLHGGFVGFGNHIWSAKKVTVGGVPGVAMTLVSPNGDEGSAFEPSCHCTGYPGKLRLTVTFSLNNAGQLLMHYHATVTGKATVINFTNHDYFNLAGESSGPIYNQVVQINAGHFTPTDAGLIPTGRIAPVAGTPFDFTHPKTIGRDITDNNRQLLLAHGFDHNWVLNSTGPRMHGLHLAARAWDRHSGRMLTVWTDQPGVQFYTGNFLDGSLVGISGHIYRQSWGYTFETQHFPDSPNHPNFPSTVLRPGQVFNSSTIYQFGVAH